MRHFELWLNIVLEHWKIQIVFYVSVFFIFSVTDFDLGGSPLLSMCVGFFVSVSVKAIGASVSLLKAFLIIHFCRKGNARFLSIYRGWVGREFWLS